MLRNEADPPIPPFEYVIMKYREKFHMTPKQFREEVDMQDFLQDLDMMKIEAEITNGEEKSGQKTSSSLY